MRGERIDQAWSLATGRPELALCGGLQRALTPAIKEPADLAGKFGLFWVRPAISRKAHRVQKRTGASSAFRSGSSRQAPVCPSFRLRPGHGSRRPHRSRQPLSRWRRSRAVVVFGMLVHEIASEVAFDRELAPLRPLRVQRARASFEPTPFSPSSGGTSA